MQELFEQLALAVENGKRKETAPLVQQLLSAGKAPQDILEKGLIAGMSSIGVKFKEGEVFVPEVLVAARAMKAAMEVLKPALSEAGAEPKGTMVIGTVQGDLHDIGKNLVAMMCEGCGLAVIDLGVDVAPEKFVEAVREHKPKVLAISALLTTTMINIPAVLEALDAAQLRSQVKILVGGAPVTNEWASQIGADGYSADAASAADMAKAFVA